MINFKKNLHLDKTVERLKQTYKSYQSLGFMNFIKNAFYIKQESILLIKELNEPSPFESHKKIEIHSFDKSKKNELLKFYNLANISALNPEILIENYLNAGHKCFLATKEDRIIGFFWWGGKQSDFKNCLPILRYVHKNVLKQNDDVLGIDFFILPEERGDGRAPEFYAKVCRQLNRLGYKHILGTVLSDNRAARWTYHVLGLTEKKRIIAHRILLYKTLFRISEI